MLEPWRSNAFFHLWVISDQSQIGGLAIAKALNKCFYHRHSFTRERELSQAKVQYDIFCLTVYAFILTVYRSGVHLYMIVFTSWRTVGSRTYWTTVLMRHEAFELTIKLMITRKQIY